MFKRREGHISGYQGLKIFFQAWNLDSARGTVIIAHGQGEHSESYHRLVDFFADDSWNFLASDMRGHGRSDGKRGYAAEFEDYMKDYSLFLDLAFNEAAKTKGPVVLLGHSMGALIQLKTLIERPNLPVQAQVCSNPLLGVAVPVPDWKKKGAEYLNQYLPKMTLWNELNNEMLTRDPDVIREFEQDVLRHNRMSPGVYLGLAPAIQKVQARANEIQLRSFWQLSEEDPVVSFPENKKVFESLGSKDKQLKIYGEGARHELYNDTLRGAVFGDLKVFLDSILEDSK